MKRFNEALDMLIMEAYIVNRDIESMKRTIEVCPSCSVEYAAEAEKLGELAGTVMGVMVGLRALKRVGADGGAEAGGESPPLRRMDGDAVAGGEEADEGGAVMMRLDVLKEIARVTGREYMLRQLAEEAMELGHAALKLIRAEKGETPVTVEEAREKLVEEFADMNVMTEWLDYCELTGDEVKKVSDIETEKGTRFAQRALGEEGLKAYARGPAREREG